MKITSRDDLNELTVQQFYELSFDALAKLIFELGETDPDTDAPFVMLNGGNANAALTAGPEFDGSVIFVGTAERMTQCTKIEEVAEAVFGELAGFED